MAYLSRIPVNPLRRQAQRLLQSPQRLHAEVLGGLPEHRTGERVLWRMDPAGHAANLFVLTARRPSWAKLVEEAGWPDADGGGADIRDYDSLLDLVTLGRDFSFRVRANPVWRTRRPQTPTDSQAAALAGPRVRGVRVAALSARSQLEWFVERAGTEASAWGFTVTGGEVAPRVQVVERSQERFSRRSGSAPVIVRTATYEGVLRVVDADRLRHVLVSGLGAGKAYGCGLLTLASARA